SLADPWYVLVSESSIEFESALVILAEGRVLHFLLEKAVAHRERLDLGAHEATECVLRSAHDRLPAHVEAGIDDHRAAGAALEALDERMIAGVRFAVHRLDARGIVDVRHRGNR